MAYAKREQAWEQVRMLGQGPWGVATTLNQVRKHALELSQPYKDSSGDRLPPVEAHKANNKKAKKMKMTKSSDQAATAFLSNLK